MESKIVVIKDLHFYPDQAKRLTSFGVVTYYEDPPETHQEWLARAKGADILCTGMFGFTSEKLYELNDMFISLPFVGVQELDKELLEKNNVVISNAPGCNREAVSEWIIGMLLLSFRRLNTLTRATNLETGETLKTGLSLFDKKITILGAGNIGGHLKQICDGFSMQTTLFRRGDNLLASVRDADIVVNCLSAKRGTEGLLDKAFFSSLKKGSFFISVGRRQIYDIDALKDALDDGTLLGAADDAGSGEIGDVRDGLYKELLGHPKVLCTPHIAWCTDSEIRRSNDIMLDNIEAWLAHAPINVVT